MEAGGETAATGPESKEQAVIIDAVTGQGVRQAGVAADSQDQISVPEPTNAVTQQGDDEIARTDANGSAEGHSAQPDGAPSADPVNGTPKRTAKSAGSGKSSSKKSQKKGKKIRSLPPLEHTRGIRFTSDKRMNSDLRGAQRDAVRWLIKGADGNVREQTSITMTWPGFSTNPDDVQTAQDMYDEIRHEMTQYRVHPYVTKSYPDVELSLVPPSKGPPAPASPPAPSGKRGRPSRGNGGGSAETPSASKRGRTADGETNSASKRGRATGGAKAAPADAGSAAPVGKGAARRAADSVPERLSGVEERLEKLLSAARDCQARQSLQEAELAAREEERGEAITALASRPAAEVTQAVLEALMAKTKARDDAEQAITDGASQLAKIKQDVEALSAECERGMELLRQLRDRSLSFLGGEQ